MIVENGPSRGRCVALDRIGGVGTAPKIPMISVLIIVYPISMDLVQSCGVFGIQSDPVVKNECTNHVKKDGELATF